MLPLKIPLLPYVSANEISLIDCPEVNLNLTKITLSLAFDDDSVPNTQVNVPPLLSITPPDEHPGKAFLGTPAFGAAANISAQPLVLLNPVIQLELFGIHTQHPAQPVLAPAVTLYDIVNSEILA
tara:strand:- start:18 stop:392 length:375 start_codon:yes stop_codon:yes gene_type:complete